MLKLRRFVWSALPPVREQSGGKYTYVFHFDAKAAVTRYIREQHPEVWQRTSILNVGFYSDNLVRMSKVFKAVKEKDGSYTFSEPGSLSALHPLIHPSSTVGPLVKLLIDHPKANINLLGAGEMMSWTQYYELWSEITGIKAKVVQLPLHARDERLPGGLGREASESMSWSAEFGWGADLVLPWEVEKDVKVTRMREFIEGQDWGAVLEGAVMRE